MNADISVIIATYNRARQLKEAIDSVLAQSLPVREVIVVDDGSTDDTKSKLSQYGDRIQTFFLSNGGASAARNHGIRSSQGKWIAFLDDDDVWLPDKINRQMQLITSNPSLGLIYCSDYAVDEQLHILYRRDAENHNRGDVFERLLIKNFIFTSCTMARRDAIEKAGYMELEFKFGEDWDLWLRIAAKYQVDFVAKPLVLYRQSASGCLTRDMKASTKLRQMQTILDRAMTLRRVSNKTRRQANFELQRQWAANWLAEGRKGQALSCSFQAITSQPTVLEGYRLLAHSLVPEAVRQWAKRHKNNE